MSVVTGMTESERWNLVAWKVAAGTAFSVAVWRVFGQVYLNTRGSEWDSFGDDLDHFCGDEFYVDCATLYALLLAEDAADEENETFASGGATPYVDGQPFTPIHITYCAEDPPMPAVFVGPEPEQDEPEVSLGNYPVDRRRTWGEKVAQGLRKWADWAEAWR